MVDWVVSNCNGWGHPTVHWLSSFYLQSRVSLEKPLVRYELEKTNRPPLEKMLFWHELEKTNIILQLEKPLVRSEPGKTATSHQRRCAGPIRAGKAKHGVTRKATGLTGPVWAAIDCHFHCTIDTKQSYPVYYISLTRFINIISRATQKYHRWLAKMSIGQHFLSHSWRF